MRLHQAFNIVRGDVVSFIGAGGKTSVMMNLGYELADQGWRVLATTTTRMSEDELGLAHHAIEADASSEVISSALTQHGFVFLYSECRNGKIYGVSPDEVSYLLDSVDSDVLLVEADGARRLPLKAPYDHEPVIPIATSLVVPVASFDAIGQPLDDDHVYNSQAMIDRYGFGKGSRIRAPWIAQVVRDEQLGLRNVPENVRVMAYFSKTPPEGYGRLRARLTAQLALKKSRLQGVVMGHSPWTEEPVHEVQRPIGAVVLAAGLSTRMGQPKTLLPWEKEKPIIQHIVEQLIRARIEHIVVVTGHMAKEVKAIVKPLGVKVAYNRSYKTGEMLSSLKIGLRAMPSHVAASMVVLGDQPRIQPKVIYQVLQAYAEGKGNIVAPSYKMRRGHPILISRGYWPELLKLPRGGSPRDVINAHNDEIFYIKVDTDSVLRDVDTPQDYSDERRRAGL